jgi:hypothetical protein
MLSLFQLNVSKMIGTDEYTPFLNDLVRVLMIQVLYHIMMIITHPHEYEMYYEEFFETLLFVIVGVIGYWLVFRKFVQLT